MNISTNIQSVIIQYLTVDEINDIKTINKTIKQRNFLHNNISVIITNILLIKYKTIQNIYNKYKNIYCR